MMKGNTTITSEKPRSPTSIHRHASNTTLQTSRWSHRNPPLLLQLMRSFMVVLVLHFCLCNTRTLIQKESQEPCHYKFGGFGVHGFSPIMSTGISSCKSGRTTNNCYNDGSYFTKNRRNSAAVTQQPDQTTRASTNKHTLSFSCLSMATTTAKTNTFSSSSVTNDENTPTKQPNSLTSAVYRKTGEPIAEQVDVCIVGAGPAGLLSAIMLAQKKQSESGEPQFRHIKVLERLARPPPDPTDNELWSSSIAKFYLIGLGGRGQRALTKFHVWEEYIKQYCVEVVGRRDWTPDSDISNISIEEPGGVERIFTDRPYTTQVLPRDKLVGALYQYIQENHSDQITIDFAKEVSPIDFSYNEQDDKSSKSSAVVRVSSCVESDEQAKTPTAAEKQDVICNVDETYLLQTNLIIAADGSARTIANSIQQEDEEQSKKRSIFRKMVSPLLSKPFRVVRYEDDNRRLYKSIPLSLPKNWRNDLNYSARTKSDLNFDALPADSNGNYCGVLLMRESDSLCQSNTDPKLLKERLDTYMPQFSQLIEEEDLLKVARKAPSALPQFRYVTPRLHYPSSKEEEGTCVLLGDCAHTVKPYFGLGANSALEDVSILSDCIDESSTTGEALAKFSQRRALESKHLVEISRNLDRPGVKGVVSFIIPLILDSIFHRLFPKVFAPNAISMLQRQDITFGQGRRRKQLDRLGQLFIIGTSISGMGWILQTTIKTVAKLSGRRTSTIFGTLVGSIGCFVLLKKLLPYVFGKYEPADVLAKTEDKITAGETFIAEYKPHHHHQQQHSSSETKQQ